MIRKIVITAVLSLTGAGTVAVPVATASVPLVNAARAHGIATAYGWTSSNWSGYAITGGPFTTISGSWVIPTASKTTGATYSSSWIGIDGFNNSNLIQTGTEQDYYSGAAHYNAWWEILPAPETAISMVVHPGDHMSATITKGAPLWTITINDTTTHATFTTNQAYGGSGASAEWIQEAPTVNGSQAKLAHYGKTVFDPGTANGASPHLIATNGGAMVQGGKRVSSPSAPDSDADGFGVAYGTKAPPIPPS